ncbi:MAG: diacylglycerol kinase [Bacteroidetes bacterium]|nr:MAG: diacylglycerol kinase [Bacteroidota bacterium]
MKVVKPLSLIVAAGKNRAIGYKNHLLWSLPDDMRFFKETTTGHTVIMGRNTYLSLPKGALPNRRNIVLTADEGESFPGCVMVHSLEQAVAEADAHKENFVMGGASLYEQFFPLAQKLYYTDVEDAPEADVWFPPVRPEEWEEVKSMPHGVDERHKVAFTIRIFSRR